MESNTKRVRDMLMAGMAYSEIHEATGIPKSVISRVGFELEGRGVSLRKKTDDEIKRYLVNQMPLGNVGDILDSLTKEEIELLSAKSFASWADAIKACLRAPPSHD